MPRSGRAEHRVERARLMHSPQCQISRATGEPSAASALPRGTAVVSSLVATAAGRRFDTAKTAETAYTTLSVPVRATSRTNRSSPERSARRPNGRTWSLTAAGGIDAGRVGDADRPLSEHPNPDLDTGQNLERGCRSTHPRAGPTDAAPLRATHARWKWTRPRADRPRPRPTRGGRLVRTNRSWRHTRCRPGCTTIARRAGSDAPPFSGAGPEIRFGAFLLPRACATGPACDHRDATWSSPMTPHESRSRADTTTKLSPIRSPTRSPGSSG